MTDMNEETEIMESANRPELAQKLAELDILRQSLDTAKQKEKDMYDQLLRMGADFENFRKRSEARTQEARQFGKDEVLLEILTLSDALVQAVDASEKTEDLNSLKKGLVLVQQQFEKFLKDQGLEPIKAIGEPLDPNQHEALMQEQSPDAEEGTIVGEIQRGYVRDGRVIRTAKVRVAAPPKK